jgi:hypothetical protein
MQTDNYVRDISTLRIEDSKEAGGKSSTGTAQRVGSLVAGEQDQRGTALAVVKSAFQGRKVLQQLGAQSVDRPSSAPRR